MTKQVKTKVFRSHDYYCVSPTAGDELEQFSNQPDIEVQGVSIAQSPTAGNSGLQDYFLTTIVVWYCLMR